MQDDLKLQNYKITRLQNSQRGYMMITLMLVLALISIALLAALPNVKQQILRDREDEMRHRGTAYMRAIQHFYKKFGRYPGKIEELENTNNVRFLRKRYTDPINRDKATGKEKDFKFLHQQDITLNNGPVLGQIPGQGGLGALGGAQGALGALGGAAGALGGAQGALGALNALGAQAGGIQQTGAGAQISASGDSDNSSSGGSSSGGAGTSSGSNGNPGSPGSPSGANGTSASGSGLNGQTFGGGPILGVASASKEKSIRIFYKKDHYNDWLFVYLPQADTGGLLKGPINPGMQTGNMGGLTPGQMAGGAAGQGGSGQSGFGQSGFGQSGFGGQGGFGQGQSGGQNQGFGSQPPQPPQAPAPSPQQ